MEKMPPKVQGSGSRKKRPAAAPPEPAPIRPTLRPHAWRILALWALALLAYSNSFRAGMTLDNATIILQDSRIRAATSQNAGLIFSQEYWYGNASTNLYRPFTTLSYLFNYAILGDGPNPAGYHWINFALHAVNILLVYLLGLLVLRQTGLALGLAGLWGLHPVLTESVTNIVGRADMLAAFGVLAGLLCYVKSTTAGGPRKLLWLAAVAVTSAMGIFSKESAIVVLAVVPLYDFTFGRGAPWRSRVPGYAALLPGVAAFFYCRAAMLAASPIGVVPFIDNPLQGAGFWTARLTAIKVIGRLFALFLWPAALSCDYSYNQIPLFSWSLNGQDAQALLALAGCGAAAWAAIRYRHHRALFFFVAFWFATLAPTANIAMPIGTIMAERFLYLPAAGLAGCLVLGLSALGRRFTATPAAACKVVGVAVGVLCLACGARTFTRNADWRDDLSLWTSAVRASPASFKAHVSLATALGSAGVGEADRGLAILRTLPDDLSNSVGYLLAGVCYRMKGDSLPSGGRYWYEKARDTLLRGEQIDHIEQEHARVLNLAQHKGPYLGGQTRIYMELGRVYERLSQPKLAIEALADGRAINPKPEFSEEMSRAYRQMGDRDGTAIALMEGMVLNPDAGELAGSLVKVYQEFHPESCAVGQTGAARSINLECRLVHDHLCVASRNVAVAYQSHGRVKKAAETANTAITQLGCPASLFSPAR
jgi:tetratricopeptide (TPR) repeat protein